MPPKFNLRYHTRTVALCAALVVATVLLSFAVGFLFAVLAEAALFLVLYAVGAVRVAKYHPLSINMHPSSHKNFFICCDAHYELRYGYGGLSLAHSNHGRSGCCLGVVVLGVECFTPGQTPPPGSEEAKYMHNSDCECWAPSSLVLMADGRRVAVELLKPGDKVWTEAGDARVDFTLRMASSRPKRMCRVGNLLLTELHPVKVGGRWVAPSAIAPVAFVAMPVLHNLILSRGHVLDIDGTLTISLGHDLREEGVEHAFFGSREAVLRALRGHETSPGVVAFNEIAAVVDNDTRQVVGWADAGQQACCH